MNTTELFLVAMLIVVTLPYLVWRRGKTDYWAPLVVVQIVAGIVLTVPVVTPKLKRLASVRGKNA